MNQEKKGIFLIVLASVTLSVDPILVRYLQEFGVYNIVFFRVFFAALVILALAIVSKRVNLKLPKTEKLKLLIFGGLHGFIILGYFTAIIYLSIASAVLLLYSASIWMILFSALILKEKITKVSIISLIIAFSGVMMVLLPQDFQITTSLIGSVSALAAGVGFGLVYVLSKTFKTYDKVSLIFWQNLIAVPFIFPLIFFKAPVLTFNITSILLIVSILSVTTFFLVYKGLALVPGQKASVLILLDIIFPIFTAFIFLQEAPTIQALIGGALIIFGSYLSSSQKT